MKIYIYIQYVIICAHTYVYISIQPIYKPQLFVRIFVQVAIVNSSYRTKDHEDVHVSGFAPGTMKSYKVLALFQL